jgi:anti-sigma B factor antagonist
VQGASVSTQRSGSIVTVALAGEVDLSAGPAVDTAITDAVAADGVARVCVDLSEVQFLDSSGIGLLLKGRRRADERGVAYRVTGAHGIARQVLELTGVWEHLCGEPGSSQVATT